MAQIAPVDRHQQQALGRQRRKQRQNAQVPDLSGIEAGNARRALSQKSASKTPTPPRAVGRDENRADVEENWMHLSKDTAFRLSGVDAKGICKEGRIRPTGPWLMRW